MKNKCACACRKHGMKACNSGLWAIGCLFTIGILDLNFWHGVWAIIVWPYYIGRALTGLL